MQAFLEACEGRRPNPVPAEAGVQALRVVEGASAARHGAAVPLDEGLAPSAAGSGSRP